MLKIQAATVFRGFGKPLLEHGELVGRYVARDLGTIDRSVLDYRLEAAGTRSEGHVNLDLCVLTQGRNEKLPASKAN